MKKQTISYQDRDQTLQLLEKHLAVAFCKASVGLVIRLSTGTVIHVNNAVNHLTGYAPEELIGTDFGLVIHPDDLVYYDSQLSELLKGELDSLVTQVRFQHKKGQWVWVKLNTTLLFDETGRILSLFSILEDVTGEVLQRDEQQRLMALIDSDSNFMAIADLAGRVTYLNEAGRELVGLDKAASLNGKIVADFSPPEHASFIHEVVLPTLLSKGRWTGRAQLIHCTTAVPIPCQASGIRIDDPHTGKPLGLGFTIRDVRSELAAQEMERKLLTLVDNSVELMSILEMDGKNSYINKAGIAMLGFDNAEQVQQTPISQLHAPEHFDLVEQQVLPSVMSTGRWSGEMLVRHLKTGEIFPIYNNTIRIDDPYSGQPIAVGAVMRDRRPELLVQRALEESELFSRNVFHHSPVAKVVLVGEALIIRTINEKMMTLLGRDATIIGKPFREAIPDLMAKALILPLDQVFTTGQVVYQSEVKLSLDRSGQSDGKYYDCIFKALHDTTGAVYGVMCTASDVTGQVLARQKAEEAERALQEAIELAQLGTWQIDLATNQIDYSPRLRAWYGLDPDEHITQEKSIASVRQADLPRIRESLASAILPGSEGRYDIEYGVEADQSGQERILRVQGKAFFNEEGVAFRITGTVQDITAQRHLQLALEQQVQQRTEELAAINEELAANNEELMAASEDVRLTNQRLEEANRLLTRSNQNLQQFAYVASHDLQEPLRKVQQFGDLVISRYGESLGEGRAYLEKMQVAASRMSLLIKDLLAFSRISTRPGPTESIELNRVIDRVLDNLSVSIGETNAEILVEELPTVPGDARQLEQLFQNLISNAIKFSCVDGSGTRQSPRIIVQAHQVAVSALEEPLKLVRPGAVYQCINVIDNGIGFDQKYSDRIFHVFQRLHSKDAFAGTGIGLAICQEVVTNHGGAITATSKLGQGATFSVYLPV